MRIVGGEYRGARLKSPQNSRVRPTSDRVRETLFNILTNHVEFDQCSVLDLFCGTGALGLEAISRGARNASFVDHHHSSLSLVRNNIDQLGVSDKTYVFSGDACRFDLVESDEKFQLVFMDPPYAKGLSELALQNLVDKYLVSPGAVVVIEEQKGCLPKASDSFTLIKERTIGDTQIALFVFN